MRYSFGSVEHGGDCCGLGHVFDFRCDHTEIQNYSIYKMSSILKRACSHRNTEVVLNGYQVKWDNYYWLKVLKKTGFILTTSFYNGNTGNIIYVFYLSQIEKSPPQMTASKKIEDYYRDLYNDPVVVSVPDTTPV